MKIVIFALAIHSHTPAGGDTIFVECAKHWISLGHTVAIITTQSGREYCTFHGFPNESIIVWRLAFFDQFGYAISIGVKTALVGVYALGLLPLQADIYFASSFFLPDSIPAAILRLIHKQSRFVTSFYVYTKKIFGFDYSGGFVKGFFFWIHEILAIWIVRRVDGYVLASSKHDENVFSQKTNIDKSRIHAVGGGVDMPVFASVSQQNTIYTAVFLGRFHKQKCIDELLRIWSIVHKAHPDWSLALIGGGSLESSLRGMVHSLHLDDVITFLGVKDGVEKIRILKSCKICVSTSRFDTGSIGLDEGLACGLPGVMYDLPSMAYQGAVLAVPVGNTEAFIGALERVLGDDVQYAKLSQSALSYAKSIDWSIKAREILDFLR